MSHIQHISYSQKTNKQSNELYNLCSELSLHDVVRIENPAVLKDNADSLLHVISTCHSIKGLLCGLKPHEFILGTKRPCFQIAEQESSLSSVFFSFPRFVIQNLRKPKHHRYGDTHMPCSFSLALGTQSYGVHTTV